MSDFDCPGLSVAGKPLPTTVNPLPLALALFTVSAAVPVDFNVRVCLAGVFKATFPNDRLLALQLMVATAGTSSIAKLFVTPPAFAVRVTDFEELTAAIVAVKLALPAFAGMVTFDGTVTDEFVLPSVTAIPPLGAEPLRVTVHVSVPALAMDEFTQERPVRMPDWFRRSTAVCEVPFALAVSVTVCELLTADTVAEKLALAEPEATVTLEGTLTDALLLERSTGNPPLEAEVVKFTVQLIVPVPVTELLLQVREDREADTLAVVAFFPFPLRDTVVFGADLESLVTVRVPDEDAACFGL